MRATIDFHGVEKVNDNPIRIVIADGEEVRDLPTYFDGEIVAFWVKMKLRGKEALWWRCASHHYTLFYLMLGGDIFCIFLTAAVV